MAPCMTTRIVISCLLLLLMCGLQAMSDGVERKKVSFHTFQALSVEGSVFCQGCKFVGTGLIARATPLRGAKVKLVCRNGFGRHLNFFSAAAFTGFHGFYRFHVPHFSFHLFVPRKHCAVFLVSSPSHTCNTPTNINFGRFGAPLRFKKSFGSGPLYSVAPLAFAPAPCKHVVVVDRFPSPPRVPSPPPVVVVDHFPAPPPTK